MPFTPSDNPFDNELGHIFASYMFAHCDIIDARGTNSIHLNERGLFECTYLASSSKQVLTVDVALTDDGVKYEIFDFKVVESRYSDAVFSYRSGQENEDLMRMFTSLLEELFMLRFWDNICDRIRAGQFEDCSAPRPH